MKYDSNNSERPFNSSLAFLERIEDTWKLVTNAKLEGNVVAYFRLLEDIFRSVHPIFTQEEGDKCEDQVGVCEKHLSNASNSRDVSNWAAENECDELKMLLVKLLFKYKITYYSAEEMTWQDELRSDFS